MLRPRFVLCAVVTLSTACGSGRDDGSRTAGECSAEFPASGQVGRPLVGAFVRASELERALASAAPAKVHDDVSAVVPFDVDGDGLLDLVISTRGGAFIARGRGGGRFDDAARASDDFLGCTHVSDLDADGHLDLACDIGSSHVRWGPGKLDAPGSLVELPGSGGGSAMSMTLWDVDEDGLLDLIFSQFGEPNRVSRNRGDRTFENVASRWGLDTPGMTWATAMLDLDRDGHDDVYVMNDGGSKTNVALRRVSPGPDGEPRFEPLRPVPLACDREGFFGFGSATPMGLAAGDLSGDGRQVLFLANTMPTPVLRDDGSGYRFVHESMIIPDRVGTTGQFLVPWSPVFWDVDHDGLLDLVLPTGDDLGFHQMGGRGESFLLLHHALRPGQFEEVHATAGLADPGHFMTVSLFDYDDDGDLDLLAGGFAQSVRVWENRIEAGPHAFVRLRGHTSNPQGLGARVRSSAGRTYVVGAHFHPQTWEEPVLDVTLGDRGSTDLTIEWPSGVRQLVTGVTKSATIDEPEVLRVEPPTRHVLADGVATALIRVRPVDESGRPVAASVELSMPFADASASWASPPSVAADGTVTRAVRSSKPGSAVVVVRIGGTELRVRPRIWFDAPSP